MQVNGVFMVQLRSIALNMLLIMKVFLYPTLFIKLHTVLS